MLVLLIVLLTVSINLLVTGGVKSSCESFAVREGEGTNITCHFDEDISEIQRDVKLFHHTSAVLTIAWKDGRPDIHSKPGYQFEGKLTKTLTVNIPRVELENGGKYSCHVVLSQALEAKPCLLVVSDRCPTNLTVSGSIHNDTECKKRNIGDDCMKEYFLAAIIAIGFMLVVSVCVNAYMCAEKRKRMKHKNHNDDQDSIQDKTTTNFEEEPTEEESNFLPNHSDGDYDNSGDSAYNSTQSGDPNFTRARIQLEIESTKQATNN